MRTIHKYILPVNGLDTVHSIPSGSVVCHVAMQDIALCIWVEVNRGVATEQRTFRVFGTGHDIPDGYAYLGTAFDREFVWHVFEKRSATGMTSHG